MSVKPDPSYSSSFASSSCRGSARCQSRRSRKRASVGPSCRCFRFFLLGVSVRCSDPPGPGLCSIGPANTRGAARTGTACEASSRFSSCGKTRTEARSVSRALLLLRPPPDPDPDPDLCPGKWTDSLAVWVSPARAARAPQIKGLPWGCRGPQSRTRCFPWRLYTCHWCIYEEERDWVCTAPPEGPGPRNERTGLDGTRGRETRLG